MAEARMANALIPEVETTWDAEIGVPAPVLGGPSASRCPRGNDERPCRNLAGQGTLHPGIGACWAHNSKKEQTAGAWTVAHIIAKALDITPWEALLLAVRRAAAWSAYYESKLAEVVEGDDDALRPGGTAYDWVVAAERVNDKMARYAKMAVDAGVAQMLVQRARAEGEQIARILNAALGAVELSQDQEMAIRSALRRALLEADGVKVPALGMGEEDV